VVTTLNQLLVQQITLLFNNQKNTIKLLQLRRKNLLLLLLQLKVNTKIL
jgi:hypothetical protein